MSAKKKIEEALDIAMSYGSCDGSHHKMWVIDQMVRALTGPRYEEWVTAARGEKMFDDEYLEEFEYEYEWDEGIPP